MKTYFKPIILSLIVGALIIFSCTKYDEILSIEDNNETKAAVTYSVYAPFDGKVTAMDTYCTGGNTHKAGIGAGCLPNNPVSMHKPTDIGTSSTSVKFYGTSNIKSIKTTTCGFLCGSKPSEGWMNNGVFVELFSDVAATKKVGIVYYGHLKTFSVKNNTVYSTGLSGKEIGTVPSSLPPTCDCYSTIHVHMTASTDGTRNSNFSCDKSVTKGATIVYSFVK